MCQPLPQPPVQIVHALNPREGFASRRGQRGLRQLRQPVHLFLSGPKLCPDAHLGASGIPADLEGNRAPVQGVLHPEMPVSVKMLQILSEHPLNGLIVGIHRAEHQFFVK